MLLVGDVLMSSEENELLVFIETRCAFSRSRETI